MTENDLAMLISFASGRNMLQSQLGTQQEWHLSGESIESIVFCEMTRNHQVICAQSASGQPRTLERYISILTLDKGVSFR